MTRYPWLYSEKSETKDLTAFWTHAVCYLEYGEYGEFLKKPSNSGFCVPHFI